MSSCARATSEPSPKRASAARLLLLGMILIVGGCSSTPALVDLVVREQRHVDIREPAQIQTAPLPVLPAPATVSEPRTAGTKMDLPLDEAIRIALENAKVIRVLAGTTVTTSGRTIYDPAVTNTAIDSARSVFDPVFGVKNTVSRVNSSLAAFDPGSPLGVGLPVTPTTSYTYDMSVTKKLVTGAVVGLDATRTTARFGGGFAPLNPQDNSTLTFSLTQPLLQGAGVRANVAPIVVARINTEISYFQLKDSVQELTRGVIEAYWNVVFARTDVWARRKQVEASEEAYVREQARFKAEFATAGSVAQTKVALANFKAILVQAEANLLQREGALRNILGLPPTEPDRVTPTTPPTFEQFQPRWDEVVQLAGEMRPDLIELALILEADQQVIVQAQNQAQAKIDATTFYRWNGLDGTTPAGARVGTNNQDWSLGVNFSVPLGLRDSRAKLRNAELVLATDRANLVQGMHSTLHTLAGNLRNLSQYYEQYKAYKDMRTAAKINLEQQAAEFTKRGAIFLNLLQAITDWGNAVSFEAQSLAQYNIELANLERQTGTILEVHGIRFFEERNGFMGPLGRHFRARLYPSSLPPTPNVPLYPDYGEPADRMLELEVPSLKDLGPPPLPKKDAPPTVGPMGEAIMLSPRLGTPTAAPLVGRSRGIDR